MLRDTMQSIATANDNLAEPTEVTHARRFARRAREHGVKVDAFKWAPLYAIAYVGPRAIRIEHNGEVAPSASYNDPHWRSILCSLHGHYLTLAGMLRLQGNKQGARRALDVCRAKRQDRGLTAPLPA